MVIGNIESKTATLLTQFEIHKPAVPVKQIAKQLGLRIQLAHLDEATSGMLVRRRGHQPLIVINRGNSKQRRTFTIAHEIGHFLLHPSKSLWVDRVEIAARNEVSARGDDRREIEANNFAAALLMPRTMLEAMFPFGPYDAWQIGYGLLVNAARVFGVSQPAMTFRLINTGIMKQ